MNAEVNFPPPLIPPENDPNEPYEWEDYAFTIHMWRWQVPKFKTDLLELVDSHFDPKWLHVDVTTQHSLLVFTEVQVHLKGQNRYCSKFDTLFKKYLYTGEVPQGTSWPYW